MRSQHRIPPPRLPNQRKRVEKPLLHQVLQTVKFKAERGRTPKVMNVAAVPEVAGLEMGDVDATWPSYHTSLDAGDPNREMGMPLQTGGKGNVQEAAGTVEDIDIEALEIIDHQQQP